MPKPKKETILYKLVIEIDLDIDPTRVRLSKEHNLPRSLDKRIQRVIRGIVYDALVGSALSDNRKTPTEFFDENGTFAGVSQHTFRLKFLQN